MIVCRIFQHWIAYFGVPGKIHSDCGGEFSNEVFREMNEKLGIETSTTPGEAPFSNDIVERNNKILYESMRNPKVIKILPLHGPCVLKTLFKMSLATRQINLFLGQT